MGDAGPRPPSARGRGAGCVTDHVQGSDPGVEAGKLTSASNVDKIDEVSLVFVVV